MKGIVMLGKEYVNFIVSTNTLKIEAVLNRIDLFLDNEDIYSKIDKELADKLKNLIKQCNHYLDKDCTNRAIYDLDTIFDIMSEIAPENCTFGYHAYNGTDLGFWYFK
ncbi:MAG: hypothetical protein K9K32_00005 [Halanaerobiales bacterium]|nr:hypothetical protein [Halanaerobiales bacterium]